MLWPASQRSIEETYSLRTLESNAQLESFNIYLNILFFFFINPLIFILKYYFVTSLHDQKLYALLKFLIVK